MKPSFRGKHGPIFTKFDNVIVWVFLKNVNIGSFKILTCGWPTAVNNF